MESSTDPTEEAKSQALALIPAYLETIDPGLIYIKKGYGSPCGAWAFWQSHKWY